MRFGLPPFPFYPDSCSEPATEQGETTFFPFGYLRHFPLFGRGFPAILSNWFFILIGFFRKGPQTRDPKAGGRGLGGRFPDACYAGGGALGGVRLGGGGRRRRTSRKGEGEWGSAKRLRRRCSLHRAAPDPGECGLVVLLLLPPPPPPPPLLPPPPPGPTDKGRKEATEEPALQPLTGLRAGAKRGHFLSGHRAEARGGGRPRRCRGQGRGPRGTEAVAGFPCPRRMGSSQGAAAWVLKGAASAAATTTTAAAAMAAGSSHRLQLLLAQ
uniref:Uncharacterized protein LOC109685334 n=1 Tax=Castor canadensis TaxID=51338 RepID=A0A8B7UF09_CASCN|nr:uncharacterized protein LOC109685334 [Castor canadensis]